MCVQAEQGGSQVREVGWELERTKTTHLEVGMERIERRRCGFGGWRGTRRRGQEVEGEGERRRRRRGEITEGGVVGIYWRAVWLTTTLAPTDHGVVSVLGILLLSPSV